MTAELADARPISPPVGSTTPRVATRRPVGRSRGSDAVKFARDVLGWEPLPWQEWVLKAGLVRAHGRWASRTVGVLVARQNGKTRLTTIRALAGMCVFGETQVLAAAQNRDVALDAWRDALEVAEDAGLAVHGIKRTNGREEFWIGRARYKVASATRGGGRGRSADLVILDEVREFRDWEAWAALEKTRRARASSQVWAVSNEGDTGSVVLAALATDGRGAARTGRHTDAAWFEWSASGDLERSDPVAWEQANPALGVLITADTIASEALHDPPTVFETEVLCRRVETLNPWLPAGTWERTGDPAVTVPDGADVVFSLDAGPEMRHATIGVGWSRPDGRVHVESVEGFDGTAGPVLVAAADRLRELVDTWQPRAVVVVARTAADATVTRILSGSGATVVRLGRSDLAAASTAFYEAAIARVLVHPVDQLTSAHVAAVTNDGVLTRRSPAADIDAAVALVLVRHGAVHAPGPQGQDWIAF